MTHLTLSVVQFRRKQAVAVLAATSIACIFFIRPNWNPEGLAHEIIEQMGFVLILICVLGRAWSTIYIGGRKKVELIREGPYSVTRNPLYMFSFLGIAGIGAGTGSISLGVILLLLYYPIFRWVVTHEETYLTDIHGSEYQRYMLDVPRFFPDLRKWSDVEDTLVRPRVVVRTTLEASLFFLAYPLLETVEWLREERFLTAPIVLP